MGKFDSLTKYIPKLKDEGFVSWISEERKSGRRVLMPDGTNEKYLDIMGDFSRAFDAFLASHGEYNTENYMKAVEEYGICSDPGVLESMNDYDIIMIICGAFRAERFCEGAILCSFEDGSFVRWLERLGQLEPEEKKGFFKKLFGK